VDTKLHFGKVHIVEWLRPRDRRTGAELLDELEPLGIMSKPQVLTQLYRVATRDDFLRVLRGIEDEFRATARLPLLHIETHGDYDGIGVSDAEGFTFQELMEELIPLNTLTRLRLIVVMSACLGMWAVKMLQPVTRAACLAVIGPNRKLEDHELARGFQTFYRTMFQVGNGSAAYKAMNDAIDQSKPTFGMANVEMLFRMVYQDFLQDRCSPTELDKRVESLMHCIRWKYFIDHGKPMPMPLFEFWRTAMRQHVENHDEHFNGFRREYFMLDLFPENDRRFPITLADCLKEEFEETS
jgi:hypothetical protein